METRIRNCKIILMLFSFFIVSFNVYSALPKEAIFVKTTIQSFTSLYEFVVHEKSVYFRPVNRESVSGEWSLLSGVKEGNVQAISTDGNNIVVLEDKTHYLKYGKIHKRWTPKMGGELVAWRRYWFNFPVLSSFVSPFLGPLEIGEKYRSFAISFRKTYDKMLYSNYLTKRYRVSHLYLLDQTGSHILIGDPWLPGLLNFMVTPDGGRFKAESLSASGSTVMVIDRGGHVATRYIDYDLNGGQPLFRYSYDITDPLDSRVISLPPEEWQIHSPIILEGKAALSSEITVHDPTQGGEAFRNPLLRVAGTNEQGQCGFYQKEVSATSWEFYPLRECVVTKDSDAPHEALEDSSILPSYEGTLHICDIRGLDRNLNLSLDEYSPETLTHNIDLVVNHEIYHLRLHTITTLMQAIGIKKYYLGTVTIPGPVMMVINGQKKDRHVKVEISFTKNGLNMRALSLSYPFKMIFKRKD